jgi:DNA-binding SARP family transcriptional activator
MLRLATLGTLSLTWSDGASTALAPRRRALALLALVGASAKEGLSRDYAMALLWPELDAASARNNLKQTVFAIRHALGVEVFDRATSHLRLDTALIAVDLQHFERALAVGAHDDAIADYTGPFLDGFFLPDLREFERWVERVRQRVALGYARALETLAVQARLRGDLSAAVHWYRRLVEHDPVSTTAMLGLMSTLADAHEPLEALESFRQHRKLLREEFDAEPDPKVRLAAERVRQSLAYRPSGPRPVMRTSGPSQAVRTSGPSQAVRASGPSQVVRNSGPTSIGGKGPASLPTLPPLFGEPPRTTRRTSGPAPAPLRPPKPSH